MDVKRISYIFLVGFFLLLPLATQVAASSPQGAPPMPCQISGTITADGLLITGANAAYTVKITKADGSEYRDGNNLAWAEQTTGGLPNNAVGALSAGYAGYYVYRLPMYDSSGQPLGAKVGDTLYIHVYKNGNELTLVSPSVNSFVLLQGDVDSEDGKTLNIIANTPVTGISFTGKVNDKGNNPVSGATISLVGSTGTSTTSDSSGSFTLSGLPSGTSFWLKVSKTGGYLDTYSGDFNSTSHIDQAGAFTLLTDSEMGLLYSSVSGVQRDTGKGVIWGRVYAQISPKIGYVNGVQLNAVGTSKTYPIVYLDAQGAARTGATSTDTSGRFIVLNVDAGDTVTITGTKTNWSGLQRTYKTFANSLSDGRIDGTTSYTISFSGNVQDGTQSTSTNLPGVNVQLYGNSTLNVGNDGTTANFTLAGLPPDTTFSLMLTKNNYIPTYTSNMSFSSSYTSPRSYSLYNQSQIAGWGVTSGKGVIAGRVVDNANQSTGYLGGAVATYTSSKYVTSAPYIVTYVSDNSVFGGSSTYANGKFFIMNVEEGDVVTVNVALSNYAFPTKIFATHANSVSTSAFFGTYTAPTVSYTISGTVKDASTNQVINGATVVVKNGATNADVATISTNSSGIYTTTVATIGDYYISVTKTGYEDFTQLEAPFPITDTSPSVTYNAALWPTGTPQPTPVTLDLVAGWNFISFPKDPSPNNTIAEVLKEVSSNVRIVWGYDNTTKGWLKYKPGTSGPTLTNMVSGLGYWIYMNAPGSITMTNWAAPPAAIVLKPGWNLIGYNGTSGTALATALAGISSTYVIIWNWVSDTWYAHRADGQTMPVSNLITLDQKKAYWIKTNLTTGQTNWQ